jgi:hypothetical protein
MNMIRLCGHDLDPQHSRGAGLGCCNRLGCCYPKRVVRQAIKKVTPTATKKTDQDVLLFGRLGELSSSLNTEVARATRDEAEQGEACCPAHPPLCYADQL